MDTAPARLDLAGDGYRAGMEVEPGSIVIWSDIGCPWAHLVVYRLHDARKRLGLEGTLRFEHRPFPLELFNERPTPKPVLDAEVPVAGGAAPGAGWTVWSAPEWQWPVTTLPALEAVQAVQAEHPAAAEELDRALRVAFFRDTRCISMRHVILDVAARCPGVDTRALETALDDGSARRRVLTSYRAAADSGEVTGSPHVFLADGTDAHNPGIRMHWEGPEGEGFPVIDADEPACCEELVARAATNA